MMPCYAISLLAAIACYYDAGHRPYTPLPDALARHADVCRWLLTFFDDDYVIASALLLILCHTFSLLTLMLMLDIDMLTPSSHATLLMPPFCLLMLLLMPIHAYADAIC
jgi:hypothetical protein